MFKYLMFYPGFKCALNCSQLPLQQKSISFVVDYYCFSHGVRRWQQSCIRVPNVHSELKELLSQQVLHFFLKSNKQSSNSLQFSSFLGILITVISVDTIILNVSVTCPPDTHGIALHAIPIAVTESRAADTEIRILFNRHVYQILPVY